MFYYIPSGLLYLFPAFSFPPFGFPFSVLPSWHIWVQEKQEVKVAAVKPGIPGREVTRGSQWTGLPPAPWRSFTAAGHRRKFHPGDQPMSITAGCMGQRLRYELPCSSLNYLSHLMLIWPFLVLHTFVLYTSVGCIITAETEADEW